MIVIYASMVVKLTSDITCRSGVIFHSYYRGSVLYGFRIIWAEFSTQNREEYRGLKVFFQPSGSVSLTKFVRYIEVLVVIRYNGVLLRDDDCILFHYRLQSNLYLTRRENSRVFP